MIKVKDLNNKIPPNGLRLARLGDVITLNNGGCSRHCSAYGYRALH